MKGKRLWIMTSLTFHRFVDNQMDTLTYKHTHLRGLGENEFGVLDQTLQRHSDVNDLRFLLLLAGV